MASSRPSSSRSSSPVFQFAGEIKSVYACLSKWPWPRHELAAALLDYAKSCKGLLFADLASKSQLASNAAGKRVIRRIRAVVPDERKTFHSFRHLFIDLCRVAGIEEEVRNRLTGHAGGDRVGRRYGNGVPLPVLAAAVEKLRFPVALGNWVHSQTRSRGFRWR